MPEGNLSRRQEIVDLETVMQGMEENLGVDPFPLKHHFVDGCYARELLLPKDSTIVGKIHKHEHFIIFLSGDVTVSSEHGVERVNTPGIAVSPMGVKRAIYAHEESRIITIHVTDKTDLEDIESDVISDSFEDLQIDIDKQAHAEILIGLGERLSRKVSENQSDRINIDLESVVIKESRREGKGLFATRKITNGELIGLARVDGLRTQIGRYANHSENPNAEMLFAEDVELIAIKDIGFNEEVLVNYSANIKETLQCLG